MDEWTYRVEPSPDGLPTRESLARDYWLRMVGQVIDGRLEATFAEIAEESFAAADAFLAAAKSPVAGEKEAT